MFHRTVLSTLMVMMLASICAAQAVDPNLAGWWPMDDEGTGQVMDHSGNERHGTFQGDAHFIPDGLIDGCVDFDSNGDFINIDSWNGILGGHARSVTAWIKTTDTDTGVIVGWGSNNGTGPRMGFRLDGGRLRVEHNNGNKRGSTVVNDGSWHHIATTIPEGGTIGDVQFYVDGEVDPQASISNAGNAFNTNDETIVVIGRRPSNNDRAYGGLMDEVRIYDKALTQEEIQVLATWPRSHEPEPTDGSTHDEEFAILSWLPGGYAAEFDVYVSHDRNEVVLGAPSAYQGRQSSAFLYLMSLDLGDYYYWRVDDVEADGVTLHQGPVWSFLVPDKKAYWPDPEDGQDIIDPCNVTLSWEKGMKSILHELYLGESFDDVNDGAGDTSKGIVAAMSYTVSEALKPGTTYYWRVDETDDTMTKHKGDVWSFVTAPEFPVTDPNLVCWWPLEENSPYGVLDHSGHGNHGEFIDTPQWVEGFDGLAVEFGPNADRDEVVKSLGSSVLWPEFTITVWTKVAYVGEDQYSSIFSTHSPNSNGIQFDTDGSNPGNWRVNKVSGGQLTGTQLSTQWVHMAVACEGTVMYCYYNGWLTAALTVDDTDKTFNKFALGSNRNGDNGYEGIIDDFRVYDRRLTQDEIKQVMRIDPNLAWDPSPARSSTPDIREATQLSWMPGDLATQHDVYLGTSQNAVENAGPGSPEYKGRQGGTTYSLAGLVEFAGGPYYWRIDEINSDATITTGRIWNFTVANFFLIDDIEDYNNYSPDRIFETWLDGWGNSSNGSPIGHNPSQSEIDAGATFVETGVVHGGDQSMPYYYDNNLKYSEANMALIGDKRNWAETGINTLSIWYYGYPASVASFVEGPAGTYTMVSAGTDIYSVADSFTFAWKTLNGEGSIEARVDSIEPTAGGSRAGVMIRDSLDPNSINASLFLRSDGGMRFNRRTVAGDTTTQDTGSGFSTPFWFRLERDFAGNVTAYYAEDLGGTPDTWTEINTVSIQMSSNAYIGLVTCANAGGASTTAVMSNVTTTGNVTGATFTNQDVGVQSNVAEPMFVSIKDAAGQVGTKYHDDPEAVLATAWTEWNIPLTEFGSNVNLSNVDMISLGFGTPGNTQPGGSGLMYFDDIRLYGSRCFPNIVKPALDFSGNCVVDVADLEIMTDNWLISNYEVTPVAPSNSGLVAHYQFENNLLDSSGNGYSGDPCGTTVGYATGQIGQAMSLDGTGYVNVGNVGIDANLPRTIAGWAKASVPAEDIADWTNVFGFSGPSGASQHFDIQRRGGGVDYYCIHIYSWQQNILPMDQEWHHLAATYDGATISWYGDGHKAGSEDQYLVTSGTFQIGKRVDNSNYWPGLVDDVRVYDRALTQEEIGSLSGKTAPYMQDVGMLTTIQDGNIDVNADGAIDFLDYAGLLENWLDEQLWP